MAGAEILPRGRGVGEGGVHCDRRAEDTTTRLVFPSAKWTHREGHPNWMSVLSPHNLGHTDPASDRPPATLPFEGPERACLPLGLFLKSLDLTLTSACPASRESGPALLDLLRPDVAHLPLVTSW